MLDESGERVTIGKRADNKLVIDDDPTVSRLHAVFEFIGSAWCMTDLGSTNGTTLNGQRLFAPKTLRDGDEIVMGRTRLVFRDRQAARDSTTERLTPPPSRTSAEQRVLVELCRPILSGRAFNPPSSVREIALALQVSDSAVKQHLDRLYDKFGIYAEAGESRRVRLANEAIQRAAVTLRDLIGDSTTQT